MRGLLVLRIATDFSSTPGPRKRAEGRFSGEDFLAQCLKPRFQEALDSGGKLCVDLDGTAGYATSFLEASFGGLARHFTPAVVEAHLDLKSDDEPYLLREVKKYIAEAQPGGEAESSQR